MAASKSIVKRRPKFTDLQGQYLAFIQTYTTLHGVAPAEADMQRFFRVTPPTVHRMVLALEQWPPEYSAFTADKDNGLRNLDRAAEAEFDPAGARAKLEKYEWQSQFTASYSISARKAGC